MRNRLFIVFLAPLICILLALGGAYAWSASRGIQQAFSQQQLGDLGYFVTGARHALRAANPSIVESEMQRYSELYDARIVVFDRSGAVWAASGAGFGGESSGGFGGGGTVIEEDAAAQVNLALSGRRSEPLQTAPPWAFGDTVVVEPVFDDGSVIGAVMISASAEGARGEILMRWVWLIVGSLAIIVLLVFVVIRLANWVLQPMQRVDDAMEAIERGEMEARIDDDTGPPETRKMIRLFNQMAQEIERVVARQQEFVLNASHELRNPLSALVMRVEYLATGLDAEWEPDIEKTREEGRRMTRILDTLLYMARSGQTDSPFAPVDIVELVRGRVDAWQQVASERRVGFELRVSTRVLAVTDRTAVESALDAVLDNALKFAPRESTIDVTVELGRSLGVDDAEIVETSETASDTAANECVIAVRDRGPGLEADELAHVTDRFWRSPRDQNVAGSGLGLAIATDLLSVLNGQVRVTAPEGGGLRVSLHLPTGEG